MEAEKLRTSHAETGTSFLRLFANDYRVILICLFIVLSERKLSTLLGKSAQYNTAAAGRDKTAEDREAREKVGMAGSP